MNATPTLGMVIAYIESAANPQAMRFEPKVHDRIHAAMFADKVIANIRTIHHCTYETACVIYSTSYGLYQIMGNVLYDPNFIDCKSTIFSYAYSQQLQDYAFGMFVRRRSIDYSPHDLLNKDNRERFAYRYNGSIDYADNIVNSLNHFGVTA